MSEMERNVFILNLKLRWLLALSMLFNDSISVPEVGKQCFTWLNMFRISRCQIPYLSQILGLLRTRCSPRTRGDIRWRIPRTGIARGHRPQAVPICGIRHWISPLVCEEHLVLYLLYDITRVRWFWVWNSFKRQDLTETKWWKAMS